MFRNDQIAFVQKQLCLCFNWLTFSCTTVLSALLHCTGCKQWCQIWSLWHCKNLAFVLIFIPRHFHEFFWSFYFAGGGNRLEVGSDDDSVFNDNVSVVSNVSSGSLMKDEGKLYINQGVWNVSWLNMEGFKQHLLIGMLKRFYNLMI